MAIGPGARIGPYEVTSLLGEGGMGKVWRARHSGLKRDDALKVLPDDLASDADRLARFQREAQLLASLNHPNIAHVYGLEQADGVNALVMELVEGTTLADRLVTRTTAAGRCVADRTADRRGARRGARAGHRSSRFEAGQYQAATRWHGEGPRLRACEAGGSRRLAINGWSKRASLPLPDADQSRAS